MRRRGFGMVIAMVVLTLVGATLALLMREVGRLVQTRLESQARVAARLAVDSGAAYVAARGGTLAAELPADGLALPCEAIAPRGVRLSLTVHRAVDGAVLVRAAAAASRARATEERIVAVEGPSSAPAN
jgi:hypothetical protein